MQRKYEAFFSLALFLLLSLMERTLTITLDVDWFWRRGFIFIAANVLKLIDTVANKTLTAFTKQLSLLKGWLNSHWSQPGIFGSSWAIGTTAIWIAVLLTCYVLVYYV